MHDRLRRHQPARARGDRAQHGDVDIRMPARLGAAPGDERVVDIGMGDLEAEAAEDHPLVADLPEADYRGKHAGGWLLDLELPLDLRILPAQGFDQTDVAPERPDDKRL